MTEVLDFRVLMCTILTDIFGSSPRHLNTAESLDPRSTRDFGDALC